MRKPRTCGECRWWDQGTCDARQDEPIPAEAYPCPAFDDGGFDKAVKELLDALGQYVSIEPDKTILPWSVAIRIMNIERLLKERKR